MSSQSSDISVGHIPDDISCATYSSGWERSSLSDDYWESSSDKEDNDDDQDDLVLPQKDIFQQPKKTGKPVLFDMDYKCEFVVLPHPYKKHDTTTTSSSLPHHRTETESETLDAEQTPCVATETTFTLPLTNPWKQSGTASTSPQQEEDPWKFLEDMNKPIVKKEREQHSVHPRREDKRKTLSRPIDNSNTNKLCKYKDECRMNKNNNCSMVHILSAWKPRICRFNNSCKRKSVCGYYHTDTPLADYLQVMINTPDTIYAKNSLLYEKYL